MIALALLPILFVIALVVVIIKSQGVIKRIAIALLTLTLLSPIVLIAIVKPAQKGLIFPTFGQVSLLFSEPEDLWIPLATEIIDPTKSNYEFSITHKYVGNHEVKLLLADKESDPWEINTDDLSMTVTFYRGSEKLLSKESSFVGKFKGLRGSGLIFIDYYLPTELPVNEQLKATVEIKGNFEEFITKHDVSEIQISKGSDL